MRLTSLILSASLFVAATPSANAADVIQTTLSMGTFMHRCTSMGGTIDTGGTAYIKICRLPNGQSVACDFSTSPAYCDVYRPNQPIRDMLGTPPVSMNPDMGTKAGPKLDVGGPGTVK